MILQRTVLIVGLIVVLVMVAVEVVRFWRGERL